jgi:hypothetical protein
MKDSQYIIKKGRNNHTAVLFTGADIIVAHVVVITGTNASLASVVLGTGVVIGILVAGAGLTYYDFHFLLYFTFISHHFSFTIT